MIESYYTDIEYLKKGLQEYWENKNEESEKLITKAIEHSHPDCYVTDVDCDEDFSVQVLILAETKQDFSIVLNQLEVIFGRPIDLWCCHIEEHQYSIGHSESIGDDKE